MTTKKKVILISVIVVIAATAAIYFYLKGKKALDTFEAGADDQDKAIYEEMVNIIRADPGANANWSWMQELLIKDYKSPGTQMAGFHGVNGKKTKSGALLKLYEAVGLAPGEWKTKDDAAKAQEAITHQKIWDLFAAYKTQKEGEAFIA